MKVKACIDCKYCETTVRIRGINERTTDYHCHHPYVTTFLVTGEKGWPRNCWETRRGDCGAEGKFFEEKQNEI